MFNAALAALDLAKAHADGGKRDDAIAALRASLAAAEGDAHVSAEARRRLRTMLEFTEGVARSFDEVLHLPTPVLAKLIKMGGAVARLAGLTAGRSARRSEDD